MDHSMFDRRCCGDTGEESEGWITDSVWDRRCGDTVEESEGWITVCGTDVVVILVKTVRDESQCVGQTLWCYW